MSEDQNSELTPFEERLDDAIADVLAAGRTTLEGVGLSVDVDFTESRSEL